VVGKGHLTWLTAEDSFPVISRFAFFPVRTMLYYRQTFLDSRFGSMVSAQESSGSK